MIAALEQSGGAWLPTIHPIGTIADVVDARGVLLERDGIRFGGWTMPAPVTIAVGPEGGFTEAELGAFHGAGWTAASLGDVTLRFETAAIGAVAIARSHLI